LLVIQESKFPATLALTLIEPSSRLVWKCEYEVQNEIMSPASFSVVDQGSLESFMAVVYDMSHEKTLFTPIEGETKQWGNWTLLEETDKKFLVDGESINRDLKI